MGEIIDWVKNSVTLCADYAIESEEKRRGFRKLETQYCAMSVEEKLKIKDIMTSQFGIKDLIYVYSCFIYYMECEDFKKDIMDVILRGEFGAFQGSMLERQIVAKIKGKYEDKRELHKRNVDAFQDVIGVKFPYIPFEKRDKKRIVIITAQMLSVLHAPTKVVLDYAYVLQEYLGYEVLLFACPCDGMLPQDMWYRESLFCENSMKEYSENPMKITYRNVEFIGYQINMTAVAKKEYAMMLSLIHAYNPMFVLAMGIRNPVADLPENFTTVVNIGMTTECSVSEAGIILRLSRKDEETEAMYASVIRDRQKQIFMEERFPVVIEKCQNVFSREELGLPENKFLIAIVGNRLDKEIDTEFVDVMKCVVERYIDVAFVIIGKAEKAKERIEAAGILNRVFFLGYCEELIGTYKALDLYMNPRRVGGGFSSAMALQGEIPVVTLPNCDVAYNVGEEFVVKDYEQMVEEIGRYVSDREFYEAKKVLAQKVANKNTDDKLVDYVKRVVDKILAAIKEQEE